MLSSKDPLITKIVDAILQYSAERPKAIILFGSRAVGKHRPDSDIDLGILWSRKQHWETVADLKAALETALNMDVDLVDLLEASPILRRQVIEKNLILFSEDSKFYEWWKIKSLNEYDDLKIVRRPIEAALRNGVLSSAQQRHSNCQSSNNPAMSKKD